MEMWHVIVLTISVVTCISVSPDDNNMFNLDVPEACVNKDYCNVKPEKYYLLEKKMDAILSQFLAQSTIMRSARSIPDNEHNFNMKNIEPRILSPESDWHNCPYTTQKITPYIYNNFNKGNMEPVVIIQTKLMPQVFDMVQCAQKYIPNTDEQCFQNLPIKDFGLKSKCVTNYATRPVFLYNYKQHNIVIKYLDFPVSCSCRVSYKDEL